MSLLVHRAGLLTTVQDLGRWGHQGAGVSVAGPMDAWSHRLANVLIDNPVDCAVLEATITGPLFECEGETLLSITGAPFEITLGQQRVRSPLIAQAPAGTVVQFGECLAGARAYVAVAGGFDVPVVLGSRATDLRAGFGGYAGRALHAGDRLAIGFREAQRVGVHADTPGHASPSAVIEIRELPDAAHAPARTAVTRLRVMRGPTEGSAADRAFSQLLAGVFRISPRSDRMGYWLDGGGVAPGATASMITGPTTMGLLQVLPSGEPILLMADRQTTGGYAAVAVVIAADLPVAGQLAPGATVAFEPCTPDDAHRVLLDRETQLSSIARPR